MSVFFSMAVALAAGLFLCVMGACVAGVAFLAEYRKRKCFNVHYPVKGRCCKGQGFEKAVGRQRSALGTVTPPILLLPTVEGFPGPASCQRGGPLGRMMIAHVNQESLERWWGRTHDLRRWVQLKLDSIATVATGQYYSPNCDSDCDLESGFALSTAREKSAEGENRTIGPSQKPLHGGPIRRSVHRGGQIGGGTPAHGSASPPTEFGEYSEYAVHGSLFEVPGGQTEQQHEQLPRPPHGPPRHASVIAALNGPPKAGSLTSTLSTEGSTISAEPHAPRVQRAQRRGTSFDAGGTSLREAGAGTCDVRGCAPNSARGNFAFASMDVSNDATNAAAKAPGNQKALPGNLFATFGGAAASSSSGHSTVNFRGQEQLIPAYVPVSKHGSLSQATHRRSSSRSGGMTNDIISGFPAGFSAEGGGGIGEGARRRAGSPQQSPSIAVKYPPRVLPPVPAFNDPGVPQGPPAPPPPSLSEGENRGRGSVFDTTLLPPAYDRVTENAVQAGRWGSDGSVRDVRIDGVAWQGNRGNNTNPNAGGGGSGETVTTSPGRRKILATPPKGYSDVATRTLAGPYLDGEDRCGRQQERAGANGATTSRLSSIENLSIATDNLQSSKPAEFESCGSPFVWNDGVADGKAQEYADNAPPSPSNVWMPRTAFHGGDTGVRRRISPRAGHRTAGTVGGGWAPVSPPQNEALYEGQEQGKERPPSLSEMGLPEDDQAQVDIGEPRICVEEVGDGKRSTGCSFRFAGQQHGTASDDACASSGLNAYPDVATPKRGTDRAQAAMKAGTTAAAAVASTAAVCVATDQPPDRSVGLRCSSPIYDRERNLLGNVQGRRGGGGGLGSETATKLIQGVPTLRSGACTPTRQGNNHSKEPVKIDANAEALIPGVAPTLAQRLVLTEDAKGGHRQSEKAPRDGEQQPPTVGEMRERAGRNLSSTEAFARSLDLPFEELELTKLIGGGGFGQVYRGLWRGTPVAVKVLVPVAQRDLGEDLSADFTAEVQMLAALRHPNVCLFMGACVAPPNRAIITELVSRGSLWEALRDENLPLDFASDSSSRGHLYDRDHAHHFRTPSRRWPWSVIVKVAEGVACGMNYLHRHQPHAILHRDLKSANLLLDDSFNVKICDFGLARLKTFTNSMTGNCGTVQWMAPEVLASKKYTETADVYSFAIVCWELLERACPYEGMSQIQVAVAVLNHALRPEIPDWCPSEFSVLLKRSWDQEPIKRPSFGNILDFIRRDPNAALDC